MTHIDEIMLELAETGTVVFYPDENIPVSELQAAAKEDGVQLRWRDRQTDGVVIMTLRKVGLGH